MTERIVIKCRHCDARIRPCQCGASDNKRHWADGPSANSSRWCWVGQLHEPEVRS